MRPSRIAVLLVLAAAPLAAQQSAKLDVELHYATGGDAWVSTNKPAYIAVFDVSRTGVSQLYPVFSAQAEMQAGVERLVNLHTPAPLPSATPQGMGLVSLTAATGSSSSFIPRWPHMLLVVASSAPLRVGNAWASNIAINHNLYQEHHFTDTETDRGVAALVDLVRPEDPGAEVVLDRIEAISTSVNAGASYASYDPNKVAVGYDCVDGDNEYFSAVPTAGVMCTAMRVVPRSLLTPGLNASVVAAGTAPGKVDSAIRSDNLKKPNARSISDPEDIRRFIEAMKPHGTDAFKAATAVGGTPTRAGAEVVAPPQGANVNRRAFDGPTAHLTAPPSTGTPSEPGARMARPMERPMERPMAAPDRPATQGPTPAPTPAQKATISAPPPAPAPATPVKPPEG